MPSPGGRRRARELPPRSWHAYAHPTPDHFLPIFIALGASGHPDRPVQTTIDGYMIGFAKRSFQTIG